MLYDISRLHETLSITIIKRAILDSSSSQFGYTGWLNVNKETGYRFYGDFQASVVSDVPSTFQYTWLNEKTMKLKTSSVNNNYRISISEEGFIDIPYVDCTGNTNISYRDYNGVYKTVAVSGLDFDNGNSSLIIPSLDDITIYYTNCGGKNFHITCPDAKFGGSTFCLLSEKTIAKRNINGGPPTFEGSIVSCGPTCKNAISNKKLTSDCATSIAKAETCSALVEKCCCVFKKDECCDLDTKKYTVAYCDTVRSKN